METTKFKRFRQGIYNTYYCRFIAVRDVPSGLIIFAEDKIDKMQFLKPGISCAEPN